MKTKHTPGPWNAKQLQCNNWSVYAADKRAVATLGLARSRTLETMEANAALIAAAPELLEQLKRLVSFYEQVRTKIALRDGYPDPAGFIENIDYKIPHIKAVIAKAEGNK